MKSYPNSKEKVQIVVFSDVVTGMSPISYMDEFMRSEKAIIYTFSKLDFQNKAPFESTIISENGVDVKVNIIYPNISQYP